MVNQITWHPCRCHTSNKSMEQQSTNSMNEIETRDLALKNISCYSSSINSSWNLLTQIRSLRDVAMSDLFSKSEKRENSIFQIRLYASLTLITVLFAGISAVSGNYLATASLISFAIFLVLQIQTAAGERVPARDTLKLLLEHLPERWRLQKWVMYNVKSDQPLSSSIQNRWVQSAE